MSNKHATIELQNLKNFNYDSNPIPIPESDEIIKFEIIKFEGINGYKGNYGKYYNKENTKEEFHFHYDYNEDVCNILNAHYKSYNYDENSHTATLDLIGGEDMLMSCVSGNSSLVNVRSEKGNTKVDYVSGGPVDIYDSEGPSHFNITAELIF